MSSLRILVRIAILILFFSCKKEAGVDQPLKDLLGSGGSWTISQFYGELVVDDYRGTSLVFHPDGYMQLQNDTASGNGRWRTSGVGDGANGVSFLTIDLSGYHFSYLATKWTVATMTNRQIELSTGTWTHQYMTIIKN